MIRECRFTQLSNRRRRPLQWTGQHSRMSENLLPTLDEPLEIVTADGTVIICWLELAGEHMRWVFLTNDLARFTGPIYRGENTLAAIHRLVSQWWETKKQLGQVD